MDLSCLVSMAGLPGLLIHSLTRTRRVLKNLFDLRLIPVTYRKGFYLLPLFIQWLVGITFETEESPVRASRRAMALFLLFLSSTVSLFLFLEFLAALFPGGIPFYRYLGFFLQSLIGLSYLLYSLFLSYGEFTGREIEARFLDTIFMKVWNFITN